MTTTLQEKIAKQRSRLRLAAAGLERAEQRHLDARVAAVEAQDEVARTSVALRLREQEVDQTQRELDALLAEADGMTTRDGGLLREAAALRRQEVRP